MKVRLVGMVVADWFVVDARRFTPSGQLARAHRGHDDGTDCAAQHPAAKETQHEHGLLRRRASGLPPHGVRGDGIGAAGLRLTAGAKGAMQPAVKAILPSDPSRQGRKLVAAVAF